MAARNLEALLWDGGYQMFPVDRGFVYVVYLELALVGLVIGALSALVVSIISRVRIHAANIALDAVLGSIACVIAVDVLWRIRVRWNFALGIIIAAALPALRELRRLWRRTEP